jgi:phage-related protein
MKNLSANIIAEKNKLHSVYPWVLLLEITLTDDTKYYFCDNNEDVSFGGNTYTAFPFELGFINSDIEGSIPVVELRVCNISRLLTPYLNSLDGGLGSTVKLTVVNTNLLAEDYSELEMEFTVMDCDAVDAYWINWRLGMFNPNRQRFPLFRYLGTFCPYNFYNDGTGECGYSGALTECEHTYEDCYAHGNEENFGGDLGLQGNGLKIV